MHSSPTSNITTAVGLFACSLVLHGGACSPSSAPSTDELIALCVIQSQATCEERATCDAKSFHYPSLDACLTAQKDLCKSLSGLQSLGLGAAPGLTTSLEVDWDRFADCTQKQAALGPSCKPSPTVTEADVLAVRSECQPASKLFRPGSRGVGEPCYVELQCSAGLTCSTHTLAGSQADVCGTCVALAEGTSCEGSSDCGLYLGLTCDVSSQTCRSYARAGEACDTLPCDPMAYLGCDAQTKTCAPLARRGESCQSLECDTGLFLYCSAVDHTCKPLPRNAGDSCQPDGVCGAGLFCDPTGFACQPLRGLGEPCASYGTICDSNAGLVCDPSTETCISAYAHPGEPCGATSTGPTSCWQSVCVSTDGAGPGTCVPYGLSGSPCETSTDTCADTFECTDGVCTSVSETIAKILAEGGGPTPESLPCL